MTLSQTGSPGSQPLKEAAREVAPWITRLARVGYLAKAVLYATVGILAAQAALGSGGRTTDLGGALRAVVRAPFGDPMLLVIAGGLLAYAVWRVVDAITDAEGRGSDPRGVAARLGSAIRGLAHLALALAAFRLATGSDDGDGPGSERLVARALDLPGGEVLVWAGAVGVLAYGGYQLYRGYAAKLGRQLSLGALPGGSARWVIALCRAGIAARGIVFLLIGVLLVRSALQSDPEEAGGLRESLAMLAAMGRWPLALVAFGLVAYALYELLNARYRRISVKF
jgi:Domain of Unknown Function (DUF1206)